MNNFILTSKSFKNEDEIPKRHTCEGENISPQLSWSELPINTLNLILIVDDIDEANFPWVYWIVKLPNNIKELPEGIDVNDIPEAKAFINDYGLNEYGGPCGSRKKTHHYRFTLFALNKIIDETLIPGTLKPPFNADQFKEILSHHILGEAKLIGK